MLFLQVNILLILSFYIIFDFIFLVKQKKGKTKHTYFQYIYVIQMAALNVLISNTSVLAKWIH